MKNISIQKLLKSDGSTDQVAVNATANVYTRSHKIAYADNMVLFYKATVASGTPDVDLYLEQGPDVPTAEGSAGDAVDAWHQIGSKLADITDELWHSIVLSPVVLPYLRIKADGQGTNPASCVLQLRLGKQEEIF